MVSRGDEALFGYLVLKTFACTWTVGINRRRKILIASDDSTKHLFGPRHAKAWRQDILLMTLDCPFSLNESLIVTRVVSTC